jgi:Na+/H+ antiporter NhaA
MYLAINGGHTSAAGWGVAMSTDTAFALGMLAPVGRRFPANLRAFILTVAVADDPGLATAIGPGVSMSFSDGLSDRGEDIGCGNPGYGVIIVGASPALGSATG